MEEFSVSWNTQQELSVSWNTLSLGGRLLSAHAVLVDRE